MATDNPHDPKYLVQKLVPLTIDDLTPPIDMSVVEIKGKEYRVEDLPEGEPVFVLRGRDPDAMGLVYLYAGIEIGRHDGLVTDRARYILAHADEFRDFTPKRKPD